LEKTKDATIIGVVLNLTVEVILEV